MVQIGNRGFALLVVLAVAAILSAISLALIGSTRIEASSAAGEWEQLAAQRLARSGQEFAQYLTSRRLGSSTEDLAGLPVEVRTPGYRYTFKFPEGAVDLFLESDAGKINLATADRLLLQNFLTLWTADATSALEIADAIKDWSDPDSDVEPHGAETGFYSSRAYPPRNGVMGIADLPLIRGLSFDDFYPRITDPAEPSVRESLGAFETGVLTGPQINPNFAPRLILLSVPGLSAGQVDGLLAARKEGVLFRNLDDLRSRVGLAEDSQARAYFRFDRGAAPAVLTVARDASGKRYSSERRVYETVMIFNARTGAYTNGVRIHTLERDRLPEFLRD